ncbi:MAG: FAD-dependent oxidoreductase [Elusimicrobiota bacterium]
MKFHFFTTLLIAMLTLRLAHAQIPEQADVVIVGAGLSGLATAFGLKKAGIKFHVLELAPRIGGRTSSVRYKREGKPDLVADSGMEEYWQGNPGLAILKDLGLPLEEGIAASSIILEKRLNPLGDESTLEFKKSILSKDEFKALMDFEKKVSPLLNELLGHKAGPETLKLKDQSFADYVLGFKMPKKTSDWIRVSVECEIGASWDKTNALDGILEYRLFIHDGRLNYRVIGGNQLFVEALADAAGRENISLNKRVTRVVSEGAGVKVYFLDSQTGNIEIIRASHVVSTIPLFRIFQVQFEPPLSAEKQKAVDSMSYGSYFKVHALVPKNTERYWTSAGHSSLPILTDNDLGVVYQGDTGQGSDTFIVSLLIFGNTAEGYNLMPADEVRQNVKAGFERLWPGFSKEIQEIHFYPFHPRAIPAWPPGRSSFDELSDEIRRPENRVYLAGDYTETSHSDGAFLSADRVVRQILEQRQNDSSK